MPPASLPLSQAARLRALSARSTLEGFLWVSLFRLSPKAHSGPHPGLLLLLTHCELPLFRHSGPFATSYPGKQEEPETKKRWRALRQQGACSQSPPRPPPAGGRRLAPPAGPSPAPWPQASCGAWRKPKEAARQGLSSSLLCVWLFRARLRCCGPDWPPGVPDQAGADPNTTIFQPGVSALPLRRGIHDGRAPLPLWPCLRSW